MAQVPLDPQFEQRKLDILTKADAAGGPWSCVFDRAQDVFVINPVGDGEILIEVEDPNTPASWIPIVDGTPLADAFAMTEDAVTDLVFRITNQGLRDLTVSAEPSIDASSNLGSPSLTVALGAPVVIPSLGTDTFTVQVTPSGIAGGSLTLSVANDDVDENPYDIDLTWSSFTPAPTGEIRVWVNSPTLGAFTELTNGGSQAVGSLIQTGAGGPFTEHYGQLELRIENDSGAAGTLSISAPTFPGVPDEVDGVVVGTVGDGTPNPFSASLGIGVSEDRYLDLITDDALSVAMSLDVSIVNDDTDENPFTFTLTGTLDAPPI